jgi:hypothetical protein
MEESGRPLRQWLGTLMAFEVPKQQDQEEDDYQHEKTEVVAFSIRAAHWNTRSHGYLDAVLWTKLRVLIKLRETLRLYFLRVGGNTPGQKSRQLYLPAFRGLPFMDPACVTEF